MGSEESGLRGPALSCPQRELQESLLCSGIKWSNGVVEHCKISNSKHQISGFQVSGVREEKEKH